MKMARWGGLIVVVVGLIGGGLPELARAQSNPLISKITWSPDGTQIAVGYDDGRLEIRNVQGNQAPLVLTGHHYRISDVAWNSTGTQLASGSEQELFVWNATTGQMIHDLNGTYGYPLNIQGISWNKDDSRIMVFTFGSPSFQTWNAATFQLVSDVDDAEIGGFSWSLDRNKLVGSNSGGLDIRDSLTFTPSAGVGEPWAYVAAWSPGAQRIVTGNWSGQIRIWDVPSEATQSETLPELPLNRTLRASTVEPDFDRRSTFVMAVAFSLSGKRVYSVSGSGKFAAWDANNGALISSTQLENAPISAAAFNQLGTKVAYGDANGELHIVDVATLVPPETFGELPTFFRISDGQAARRLLQ